MSSHNDDFLDEIPSVGDAVIYDGECDDGNAEVYDSSGADLAGAEGSKVTVIELVGDDHAKIRFPWGATTVTSILNLSLTRNKSDHCHDDHDADEAPPPLWERSDARRYMKWGANGS